MKDEEVDRFFDALGGRMQAGERNAATDAGAAARDVLRKKIEESEAHELSADDGRRREELMRELRERGHFKGPKDPAGPVWWAEIRSKPRYWLLIVVVLIVLGALIEAALHQDPDAGDSSGSTPAAPNQPMAAPAPSRPVKESHPMAPVPAPPFRFSPPARGTVAPKTTESATPDTSASVPDQIQVTIANTTARAIQNFFIQRENFTETRREILGGEHIPPGQKLLVNINTHGSCLFTFTAEFADATRKEQRDINVCTSQSFEFAP